MRVTEPYIIFPRTLTSGKIVYYYQFRYKDGTRSSLLSTGETSLSKAKRKIQKMYNSGAFAIEPKKTIFKNYTENFFDKNSEYFQFQSVAGKPIKDSTLASYTKLLNNQILPFFADYELKKITKDTVKQWILWCSKSWSAKTINNAHGVLNIIFETAIDKEIITRNPLNNLRFRPTERKQRDLLSIEELATIYKSELWCREEQRQMFLMALLTGMRIGEISALTKDCFHETYIDVKHTYSDKFGLGSTKTGEIRKVPVINVFKSTSPNAWFFAGQNDKPMLSHAVYNSFSRLCDKIGIDRKVRGITIHSLRNFFISHLQKNNISESKIKAIVGHKDKNNMTEHYTYWTPEMFPEIYEIQTKLYQQITGGGLCE